MNTDQVLAKLDVYRARRLGEMLISQTAPTFDEDPAVDLVDVASLDGKTLLARFRSQHSRFGTTPFDPEGECFRLYGGAVTIWSGYPSSGKTTMLRQLICQLLHRGSSVFLVSLEEHPHDSMVRIAATAAGCAADALSPHQMQWFIDAYANRFRLWARIGIAQHRTLLAVARKLATERIRHVIFDSLMMMDVRNDDNEAQRSFANLLSATAKAANLHIHLVAHPRKLVSSDQELDQNDVAGAREITGIADNVVFMRRANGESNDPRAAYTPMRIAVRKQRDFTGWRGEVTGWFQRGSHQFSMEQFPLRAERYLPDDAYVEYPIASNGSSHLIAEAS